MKPLGGNRNAKQRAADRGSSNKKRGLLVRLAGFEPATCCSGGNRSIHLSYRRTLLIKNDLFHLRKFSDFSDCGGFCG